MAGLRESLTFLCVLIRPYFDLREELVVQGSAAPDQLSMSYTSANVGVSLKTKLSTTRVCACVGQKEMAPKELL